MMFGFLASRAILSMATILFGINALWNVHPKRWLQQKWWLLGACWVGLYALSYFWSNNKPFWEDRLMVKLPVLLLPLSFAFLPAFSLKQLRIFTGIISLMLLGGVAYSLSFLISDTEHYVSGYFFSHVLPTPAKSDHIRFSMVIAAFVIWCAYIFPKLENRTLKWFVAIVMAVFSIYIHLLAARTGLVIWYTFIFLWAIYTALKKKKIFGFGIIVLLCIFAFLAFKNIPTLFNRGMYVKYTWELYQKDGKLSALYADMNRLMSYDIAVKLIGRQPLSGVGAGDMEDEMKTGYDEVYPGTADEQKILPHNQFLIVALGCGMPALLIFIAWVLWPLKLVKRNREGFFFLVVWLVLLLPMLVEPVLEIQFGVFVYLFFLLWQRRALLHSAGHGQDS